MALTTNQGDVRIFANTPAYGVLLGLLSLYALALASFLPARGALRMPHAVTCLAEIVAYLVNADIREEPVLKRCVSKGEMEGKMGVGRGVPEEMESVWGFGVGEGDGVLGVRRVRRFTERGGVRKSQIQIRRPLLRGEGGGW
jgi:hypothetical protein